MVYVSYRIVMPLALLVMCIRFIVIRTGLYGHREFPGLLRLQQFLPDWILIFGLARRPKEITLMGCCPLTGEDGGTMELVRWVIWLAISWLPRLLSQD